MSRDSYGPREKARAALLGAILMILLSALFLNVHREARAIIAGDTAEGEVVFLERGSLRANSVYTAIVKFRARDGRTLEFRTLGARAETYAVGQHVPVRYVTAEPRVAYVDTFGGLYRNALVGVGAGLPLLWGGVALLRVRRRLLAAPAAFAAPRPPVSIAARVGWAAGGLALATVIVIAMVASSTGVPREQVEQAQRDAAALRASIGTPPGARPYGAAIESAHGGREGRATLEQEYEGPGLFAPTGAWYARQLDAKGWRIFDPSDTTAFHVEWCRAPWSFTLERHADYEGAAPTHRFRTRLEWRSGFTSGRCPLPR